MPFRFKVGAKIKEAWVLYKEHFGAMILIVLASGVLQIISQNYSKDNKNLLISLFLIIVSILISYIWIKSIMNLLDGKGFNPFTKESMPSLAAFWDFLKTNILISLCVMPLFAIIGLIILFAVITSQFAPVAFPIILIIAMVLVLLLIIPALYIIGRLFPAVYISVEKYQGARKTIKEAWTMTKGNAWNILGKSVLVGLFIFLGFIALIIGLAITYPVGMIVMVMMYRELVKFKTPSSIPETVIAPEIPKVEVKVEVKIGETPEVKEEGVKEEVK